MARKLARLGVVDAAIDAIDDEILAVGHLVGDADLDDAPDDRLGFPCATEDGEVASWAVDAVRAHDPVHGDHDVAALTQAAQLGFELGIDGPDAYSFLLRQSHLLQLPQPANPHAELRAFGTRLGTPALAVERGRHDEDVLLGVFEDAAIERCEPLRLHLVGELDDALQLLLGAQFQGDEVLRAMADAVADVVARHHEVLAAVVMASDDDMGVRMPGVEMIDGGPVEPGVQVLLHGRHEITHKRLEVRHAATVLRRDDEAELIGVALLTLQEVATLGHIVLPVVELAGTTVTRHTVAHDVVLMRARGGEVGRTVPSNACLDDDAAPAGRWRCQSVECPLAAAELGDGASRQRVGPGRFGCAVSRSRFDDHAREATGFDFAARSRLTEFGFEFRV